MNWSSAKGIIFDLDGLLLDSERVSRDCWLQAAGEHGISLREIYPRLIGRGVVECDRILAEHVNTKASLSAMRARKNELFDRHIKTEGIPLKTGALQILSDAKAAGKQVALATGSTNQAATRKLEAHKAMRALFDVEVFGDDVKNGKPSPDIFLFAARRLGLFPAACIVLEDSVAGMQAARAASMPAIIVPDLVPIEKPFGDEGIRIVDSLLDALRILELNLSIPDGATEEKHGCH